MATLPIVAVTGAVIAASWGNDARTGLTENPANLATAKGDVFAATAAGAIARVAVGADQTFLVADSSQSAGVAWQEGFLQQFGNSVRLYAIWPHPRVTEAGTLDGVIVNGVFGRVGGGAGTARIGENYENTNRWAYAEYVTGTGGAAADEAVADWLLGWTVPRLLPRMLLAAGTVDTASVEYRLGFGDGTLDVDPTNGAFFRSLSGGNWFAVVRNAGVETATDTTIAPTTAPKEFELRFVSATQVDFYIDGTLRRSETGANIPAIDTEIRPGVAVQALAAAAKELRTSLWLAFSHMTKVA